MTLRAETERPWERTIRQRFSDRIGLEGRCEAERQQDRDEDGGRRNRKLGCRNRVR